MLKENQPSQNSQTLTPYFSPIGTWAFSIGTSIGWGSFVVTCTSYLSQAGILGTIIGLVLGLMLVLIINHNLCYMMERYPDPGGIYNYGGKVDSQDTGFIIGWFLLLTYLAVLWANITSLPLFADRFLGSYFQFGFNYTVFGYRVYLGEAMLSIVAMLLVGFLCSKSRRLPQYLMIIMSLFFVGSLIVCTVFALLSHGRTGFVYEPAYIPEKAEWDQIIRIAVISPWAFIGFENVAHFSAEFDYPLKKVKRVMLLSVTLTTLVYVAMTLLSVSAYPAEYASWLDYIKDMGNLKGVQAIPAFYAARYYLGEGGVRVMLLALFSVILTSIIANLTAISRLLYAFGRDHEWTGHLGSLNKHGIPSYAIMATCLFSCLIPFLGRTAIGWIVDVTTIGAVIIYGFLSNCVFKDASIREDRIERITGLAGTCFMVVIAVILLVPRLIAYEAMEQESYLLFAAWSLLGFLFFTLIIKKDRLYKYGYSLVVWLVLLVLMFFTVMMWGNRETQQVTKDAISQIQEYYENDSGREAASSETTDILLSAQEDRIDVSNLRNTFISLALFIFAIFIMANNYRMARKGEQEWIDKFGEAREIGLKDSLTSVKNKHAYTMWEQRLDKQINNMECDPFAVVICDINNLKYVNDVYGHLAGDECIKRSCTIICKVFSHSPVFRYGGDEFVVILQGQDFENRDSLMDQINKGAEENISHSLDETQNIIACGMAVYEPGNQKSLLRVFEQADQAMYERKKYLKQLQKSLA